MKRKESRIVWVIPNWKLKRLGLGVYHTMLWSRKGPKDKYEEKVKLRITMEEV